MAGTVTVYSDNMYGNNREVVISCVGDADDGQEVHSATYKIKLHLVGWR